MLLTVINVRVRRSFIRRRVLKMGDFSISSLGKVEYFETPSLCVFERSNFLRDWKNRFSETRGERFLSAQLPDARSSLFVPMSRMCLYDNPFRNRLTAVMWRLLKLLARHTGREVPCVKSKSRSTNEQAGIKRWLKRVEFGGSPWIINFYKWTRGTTRSGRAMGNFGIESWSEIL